MSLAEDETMPKNKKTALILLMCFVGAIPVFAKVDVSFNREATFGPMRISYSDLYQVISQAQSLVATANQGREQSQRNAETRIESKGSTFNLEGIVGKDSFSQAPSSANYVFFEYRNWDAPITHIEIRLSDTRRTLEVKGKSIEQVEAVYRVLTSKLEELAGGLGGSQFRTFGAIVLLISGGLFPLLSFLFRSRYIEIALLVLGPLLSISVWVFPWNDWFPGVVVVHGDASFIVRYASELSFVGLVLTLVTFLLSIVYARHLASRGMNIALPKKIDAEAKKKSVKSKKRHAI